MILYTTDLHGKHFEIILKRASQNDIDTIILGADILPKEIKRVSKNSIGVISLEEDIFPKEVVIYVRDEKKEVEELIDLQKNFLLNDLIPKMKEFKKTKKEIYLMFGNDDLACNLFLLEEAEKQGLCKLLHNKRHKLTEDIDIVGYPYVPLTHFLLKDWEKFDDEESPLGDASLSGYITKGSKIIKKEFDLDDRKNNIAKDLEKIAENASRTIYVIHAPPFNTSLDMISENQVLGHVGSRAVKEFILQKQPLATFHGHIHESYALTARYMEKISNTICINPGQDYGIVNNRIVRAFNYALFDPYDIENAKIFSVLT